MPSPFEPTQHLDRVAQRLIREFDDAAEVGTPGLIGASREHPARKSLELLLPGTVSVGSGIVMDSARSLSTQQDIVVFERDHCPIFSINQTPEATYYPVEGVVAVGEVKSTVDKATMEDALNKIVSAKRLLKQEIVSPSSLGGSLRNYRLYGTSAEFAACPGNELDRLQRADSQIFGFLLCHRFSTTAHTMMKNIAAHLQGVPLHERPNMIVSLHDGAILYMNTVTNTAHDSAMDADAMAFSPTTGGGFTYLLQRLKVVCRDGRTAPLAAFDAYFNPPGSAPPTLPVVATEAL